MLLKFGCIKDPLIFPHLAELLGTPKSRAYHADATTPACDRFLSPAGGIDGMCDYHQDVFSYLYFQERKKLKHLGLI